MTLRVVKTIICGAVYDDKIGIMALLVYKDIPE